MKERGLGSLSFMDGMGRVLWAICFGWLACSSSAIEFHSMKEESCATNQQSKGAPAREWNERNDNEVNETTGRSAVNNERNIITLC